ncbi:hypothetical protein Lesp02_45030 [Lentzea sp. NBRC 105346]|uniref:hypothetical protein n=1 Tax=Lentzea sp. NBRC 105346 TaxID=3032205 RepID=UPI00249FD471|nr:hypothetical protein [Lentzea sp. NBRC 105346]GLZ32315.1 hypothetical protein Lesp02_45030 [Lentzea sp. NBRC 105346]
MRRFMLPIIALVAVAALSACGTAKPSAEPLRSSTTATTTTTSKPLPPVIDTAKYAGVAASTAVAEIQKLGYYIYVTDAEKKSNLFFLSIRDSLPESLGKWVVSSIEANRSSYSVATVWVKRGELAPAEKVDDAVQKAGLESAIDRTYRNASAWVLDVCESMASPSKYVTASEFLQGQTGDDAKRLEIFKIGIPALCVEHQGALNDVLEGNVPFGSGTYEIGTGKGKIKPGTYRTTRSVDSCYWERTRPDGEIIDNNFVTHAQSITVTVAPTDGSFTNQRCGTWQLVK